MGVVYTLLCLRSAELSKAFGLRNLCYSRISLVMFSKPYRGKNSSQNEKKYALRSNAAYLNS